MIPNTLLPEGTSYCIAGGWAACPALALDKDVWVFADPQEDIVALRDILLKHLEDDNAEYEVEDETRNAAGYEGVISILRVAKVEVPGSVPIHLIVTNALDPHDLISSFDVSAHQIALSSQGHVIKGGNFTPVTVKPVKLKDTPTTDERMRKIAERYGHPSPFSILEP